MTRHVRGTTRLTGLVTPFAMGAESASVHAKYVTSEGDSVEVVTFLPATLTDLFNLTVLDAGGVGIAVAGVAYLWSQPFLNGVRVFRRAMASCESFLPWLFRLAVRLPLVGTGFLGYFSPPAVQSSSPVFVRLFGITVGFLLLFRFGTRFVATIGLGAHLAGLAVESVLVLVFGYAPSSSATALVDGGRPSADHVVTSMAADDRTLCSRIDPFYHRVALPFVERTYHLEACVPAILRIGLNLTFVYLGVAQKLMEPGDAPVVVTKYDLIAVALVAPELRVVSAGLTEALVGALLADGTFIRAAFGVAFLLFTTTLFGLPDDPVLTHISLFGLMLALLMTGGEPLSVDHTLSSRGADDTGNDGDASGRSIDT